jgi:uncharacterized protein involved in response to NO
MPRPVARPALFSYGFRPFFLAGAAYAGLAVLVWVPAFTGHLALSTAFAPRDWHVHEMLFGYVAAVVAGFLLTAVPNWTGRLPISGPRLIVLFSVWVAGRLAVTLSAALGWLAAAAIDGAFLVVLAAALAREIVAGRKWSNLKVVGLVVLLACGNLAFHTEAHWHGTAEITARLGVAVVIVLVMLIGGRIVPSFTRNWLARQRPGRLPLPFNRFDAAAVGVSAAALLLWVAVPEGGVTAALLGLAGVLQLVRLARWAGERTWPDRLVLILHLAYAFVPAGLWLAALGALGLVLPSAGIHAFTGGAIGVMTLAVMTRATLGHTGQALTASPATQALYGAAIAAALLRVCAALRPDLGGLLVAAGLAWAIAFLGFAAVYGGALLRPRRS